MLHPRGDRDGRTWTGSAVTVEASDGKVRVYAPCGAWRKMSPETAREIARKLIVAADLAENKVDNQDGLAMLGKETGNVLA